MEKVKKEEWTKSWSTRYPMVFLEAFAEGYTKYAKKYFGRSFFEPIIFEYNKGVATVYRKDKEILKMQKHFVNFLHKDKNFLKDGIDKMFSFFDQIDKKANKDIFKSINGFQSFFDLIAESLTLYIMMIWTPDGLKVSKFNNVDKEIFLNQCSDARKQTEHFYPNLVKKFESLLKQFSKNNESLQKLDLFACNLQEIKKIIRQDRISNIEDISKRFDYSVFIKKQNKKTFILGDRAKKFVDSLIPMDLNLKIISGTIAMKGKAKGIVTILLRDEDLSKFKNKKDTILVSTMTRPEWTQVMQKSNAFITDAGGLLCHAAIVARELKKPCIIGTKIATKVLKDGDYVEVDANIGVVKVLKRIK